jgi:hypothetical protein
MYPNIRNGDPLLRFQEILHLWAQGIFQLWRHLIDILHGVRNLFYIVGSVSMPSYHLKSPFNACAPNNLENLRPTPFI